MKKSYTAYEKAEDPIYGYIREFIMKHRIKRVLDVGCGPGRLMDDITAICEVEGVDSSDELLETCRKKGYRVRRGDARKLPYKTNSFDFVVAKDLIEHFADNIKVLKELIRVSKKYVFLSAVGPVPEFAWGDYTHIRPYTKRALELMVQDHGLKVLSVGSVKRKLPFRIMAKIFYQPIDDISVYVFASKPSSGD